MKFTFIEKFLILATALIMILIIGRHINKPQIKTEMQDISKITVAEAKLERQILSRKLDVQYSHSVGYLMKGARWLDSSGQNYRNSEDVQIEIWSREVVTSDGEKLTQIYFLEGENQGLWGYVDKRFTSSYIVKKSKN